MLHKLTHGVEDILVNTSHISCAYNYVPTHMHTYTSHTHTVIHMHTHIVLVQNIACRAKYL